MIETVLNPAGVEAEYLRCLNECFPGWGGVGSFNWAFRRIAGGPPADLMVLRDGAETLAGSAVTYRTLRVPGRGEALVGIMTGSWTLPAARGRGCFTRVIEESVACVARHGGAFLLAFVTETNPSYRRLAAAGSALFPTRYLVSPPAGEDRSSAEPPAATEIPTPPDTAFAEFEAGREPGTTFAYATPDEWAGQFLGRSGRFSTVGMPGLGWCVVEEHGEFDRLQAAVPAQPDRRTGLVRAMLARARSRGRRMFCFSSNPVAGETLAAELGLAAIPGFLTVLPAAADAVRSLFGGAGPVSAAELADASSPYHLGAFSLQGGDRM